MLLSNKTPPDWTVQAHIKLEKQIKTSSFFPTKETVALRTQG